MPFYTNEKERFLVKNSFKFIKYIWKDKSFIQQIEAIAKIAEVEPGFILALNALYEIGNGCTAVLANLPNGQPILAHVLDYNLFGHIDKMT